MIELMLTAHLPIGTAPIPKAPELEHPDMLLPQGPRGGS